MKFIINVETGSTFTSGFLVGDRVEWVKVWTTPQDPIVCFTDCLEKLSQKIGVPMEELLRQTVLIRYGTAIATDCLLKKTGPKLGMIVSEGFADTVYSPKSYPRTTSDFISPGMIAGVAGKIDERGIVIQPLDREGLRATAESLLDSGARGLVISLRNSPLNPSHEQESKEVIESEYPRHYLGAVPIFLSTGISACSDDHLRTNTAILNTFLHRDVVRYLFQLEDCLRHWGYRKPLFIAHSGGGVATVAKTVALYTYNSGPVAGYAGCARIASQVYGVKDFVSVDTGGTSVHIGVGGELTTEREPVICGIRTGFPMIPVYTMSGGGNTKAWVDPETSRIKIGPESTGVSPGPACYDLGGMAPTVCDAELVLGYLDADYYLGGAKKLNKERAIAALRNSICNKLGISVEEAAFRVIQQFETDVANQIGSVIQKNRHQPRRLTMFAFGGIGGGHCCGYASNLGIRKVIVFRFNSVACAFGMSMTDVVHSYRCATRITLDLSSKKALTDELKSFNTAVDRLVERARRDMLGEGLDPSNMELNWQLAAQGDAGLAVLNLPWLHLEGEEQAKRIVELYGSQTKYGARKKARLAVQEITLRTSCPLSHHELPEFEYRGKNPEKACKGQRDVFWKNNHIPTKIYERDLLECGNTIDGPAIIEAPDTTYVIAPHWTYAVDKYLNGILEARC